MKESNFQQEKLDETEKFETSDTMKRSFSQHGKKIDTENSKMAGKVKGNESNEESENVYRDTTQSMKESKPQQEHLDEEKAELKQQLIQNEIWKVEAVLLANGLKRVQVRPYGDCFFEASGKQLNMTASMLRDHLCKILDDKLEDYISFVMNSYNPDNEEAFVREYLNEIEKLKEEGYWTSNVADFLPLALANYSGRNVVIYTNKDEQPIIKISPLESYRLETETENEIKLAYISIPGVFEHYDACSEISAPIVDIGYEERMRIQLTARQNSAPEDSLSPTKRKTTLRKRVVYITPQKKVLTCKRKATPQNWKKNIRKHLKLSGEEYTSADGKTRPAKSLKHVDCSRCRFKCDKKITQEQRQQVFDSFWEIGNFQRQKDYVCTKIEERNTKTILDEAGKKQTKKKQLARRFFLEVEGVRHQTCKTFFMNTLSIGKGYIDHAMKNKKRGHFVGTDLRGKHAPHNKLNTNTFDYVKRHIESFPTVGGHYVRKETNRQFLSSELTLPKMYELYLEKCTIDNMQPVKISTYRKIFCEKLDVEAHIETAKNVKERNTHEEELDNIEHGDIAVIIKEINFQQEHRINNEKCEISNNVKERNVQQKKSDDTENFETSDTMKQSYSKHGKEIDMENSEMKEEVKETELKQHQESENVGIETIGSVKESKIKQEQLDELNLTLQEYIGITGSFEENMQQEQEHVISNFVNEMETCNDEQKQSESSEFGGGIKESELQGQVAKMRKNQTKKRKTRQIMKYVSFCRSDQNIPLSDYKLDTPNAKTPNAKIVEEENFNLSDSETTEKHEDQLYDPLKDNVNSTYSGCKYVIPKMIRKKSKNEQNFKRLWDKTVKGLQQRKRNENKKNLIQDILQKHAEEAELKQQLIQKETCKVETVLMANGLKREQVQPNGDCFFEASGKQLNMTASMLRDHLCKILDDKLEDYISFVMNSYNPDNEEAFVREYLNEIEKLKEEGYWTSNVADFLPLALANYSGRNVVIYTNKDEQPIIKISPLESYRLETETENDIKLAYISIPGVFEHYDACSDITAPIADIRYEERMRIQLTSRQNSAPEDSLSPTKRKTTQRKRTVNITLQKKVFTCKREATPQNWKKNIRKHLKLSGEEYTSADGKTRPAKSLKHVDCSRCRFKCDKKITQEQRQQVFDSFWEIGNFQRQKDYVCTKIEERNTKTILAEAGKKQTKKRQLTRRFFLEVEGVKHQTCKMFFMNTLSIGKGYIDHAMKNKKRGYFVGTDLRGKHAPHNKLNTNTFDYVKRHIESFPTVNGNNVRKETNRQFFSSELTLPKMYELYLEKCTIDNMQPIKISTYRKIFRKNYNFSFHVPKNDQCNTCAKFNSAYQKGLVTDNQRVEYEQHQNRETRAREEKNKDKEKAKVDPKLHVACFDLQSVLYTPCSLVSIMYYMRKLCCNNFSICSLGDAKGTCFVWTETGAQRGASEIATCLRLHLLSLPEEVDHVVLYSNACGGQNRNKIIASCLLHSVNTIKHIKEIDHKFLEGGHNNMEVDSIYAGIEFAKKRTQIFVPSQWNTVLQMARRRNPYKVVPLNHTDILDYQLYQDTNMKPQKQTETGAKPFWSRMKWLRYVQSEPDTIYFKYDFDGDFDKVKVTGLKGQLTSDDSLPVKYQKQIPISSAKKRDLVQLCEGGYIPSEFHGFYKSLPSSGNSKDSLPQPDVLEETSDESEIE